MLGLGVMHVEYSQYKSLIGASLSYKHVSVKFLCRKLYIEVC